MKKKSIRSAFPVVMVVVPELVQGLERIPTLNLKIKLLNWMDIKHLSDNNLDCHSVVKAHVYKIPYINVPSDLEDTLTLCLTVF